VVRAPLPWLSSLRLAQRLGALLQPLDVATPTRAAGKLRVVVPSCCLGLACASFLPPEPTVPLLGVCVYFCRLSLFSRFECMRELFMPLSLLFGFYVSALRFRPTFPTYAAV
jgi:hypothetical protein